MNVYVVVVNGKPKSGKSTLQRNIQQYLHDHDGCIESGEKPIAIETYIKSSVSKMYEVERLLGWDGVKTNQFRDDMATLKQIYIRNCNGPIRDIVRFAVNRSVEGKGDAGIIFYDCREESEITALERILLPLSDIGIYFKTLFVRRKAVEYEQYGNDADNKVFDGGREYDITFMNDGEEVGIYNKCEDILKLILEA